MTRQVLNSSIIRVDRETHHVNRFPVRMHASSLDWQLRPDAGNQSLSSSSARGHCSTASPSAPVIVAWPDGLEEHSKKSTSEMVAEIASDGIAIGVEDPPENPKRSEREHRLIPETTAFAYRSTLPMLLRGKKEATYYEPGSNSKEDNTAKTRDVYDSVLCFRDNDAPKSYDVDTNVGSAMEALKLLHEARKSPDDVFVNARSEYGLLTRALAGKFGCRYVHGVLGKPKPGDATVQQLLTVYRVRQQTSATKVFGIVGKPVSHDLGFLLHNALFEHSGVDAVYVPILVDELAPFLEAFSDRDFGGFSVTMPHKATALALADIIDPIARDCGAANTLVAVPAENTAKVKWSAHNTDWLGAVGAIEAGLTGDDLHDSYARAS